MKTPYGQECVYYYADYYRGNETQNCRLIERNPSSEPWSVSLCQTCPVPGILAANHSPNMRLRGWVGKGFLGITRKVQVEAICIEHGVEIKDPKAGCPQCAQAKSLVRKT